VFLDGGQKIFCTTNLAGVNKTNEKCTNTQARFIFVLPFGCRTPVRSEIFYSIRHHISHFTGVAAAYQTAA
jgi:hypothetical protein